MPWKGWRSDRVAASNGRDKIQSISELVHERLAALQCFVDGLSLELQRAEVAEDSTEENLRDWTSACKIH